VTARVLDVLESFYLRLWKIIVQCITVVKFRMNDRSVDGTGSFEVKIRTNTAKITNVIIARFRQSRYLVRERVRCSSKIQDAQLSQRDRAAVCVIVFAKSIRLELRDNILRTL